MELRSDGCGYFCGTSFFVGVRHRLLPKAACPHVAIINAGDGRHAHPTRAMLDMLTIRRETKKKFEDISIPIVGNIKHSRVARSDVAALQTLGL